MHLGGCQMIDHYYFFEIPLYPVYPVCDWILANPSSTHMQETLKVIHPMILVKQLDNLYLNYQNNCRNTKILWLAYGFEL